MISKKAKIKLKGLWKTLVSNQQYLIPESIEDFNKLGPIPDFQLGSYFVYAKPDAKRSFKEFTELLREELGPNIYSYTTIYFAVRDEVINYFSGKVDKLFDSHIERIVNSIRATAHRYQHLWQIFGLKLQEIEQFSHGPWQIVSFTKSMAEELAKKDAGDKGWQQRVEDFLNKYYSNKTCIIVESYGDHECSKKNAEVIARYVVNTLRYFICIHAREGGLSRQIGISLSIPYLHPIEGFSLDVDNAKSRKGYGYDHYRYEYHLTSENLRIIMESYYADLIWGLIEKSELTDLEGSIMSAITWLGDAQQDNSDLIAYTKYWISLEAISTGHIQERIIARLKTTLPALIGVVSKAIPSKSEVERAYELRCEIIHGRSRVVPETKHINQIATWTYQCVTACIYLLSLGYTNREQVEREAIRTTPQRTWRQIVRWLRSKFGRFKISKMF